MQADIGATAISSELCRDSGRGGSIIKEDKDTEGKEEILEECLSIYLFW